ncbi:MAG: glycerophosphodiester phosphodiesterase, partial [Burkholderiales bacterium]
MKWPYPKFVAHRGGGALAPENTLGAMRKGAAMGFKGVEFDVMLAGDGTPVVIHDETVDRTTNGRGSVPGMTWDQLSRFKIGEQDRIPKYEEVVALCRELGLWANVEIKPAKGHERATGEAVARMTREFWQGAPLAPLLSSFSIEALAAAQAAAPELSRGGLCDKVPESWRELMKRLGCVSLHCNYKALNAKLAADIHEAGYG